MSTYKDRVRKRARIAQMAAAGALATGAAAALVPLPKPGEGGDGGLKIAPPTMADTGAKADINVSEFQLASRVMSTSVELRKKHRPEEPKVEVAVNPEPDKPIEEPKQTSGPWQYVGTIISPKSKVAVVNVEGGKQRFFYEGDKHEATTVVAIEPDHIMIRDGNDAPARRLDLLARSATLFPEMAATPFATPSSSANGLPAEFQKPPVGFDNWPPDKQQEWMERRSMVERQIAEARMKNNPAANNGRPVPGRTPNPMPGKQPAKDFK